ncbi:YqaE/Pmp3 family membrane protein [Ochrovirga pacifica]|uniref:YqaE/Pmp3 family membrane protein n=1 Tax=Ochrovirga pacifica TaxID=1042376 RepID=UPI00025591DC
MNKVVLIILSFFIPPLAVYLKRGSVDKHLFINIVLCLLVWVPAILHSLWVVTQKVILNKKESY